MELVTYHPKRAIIRCKAKMQLLEVDLEADDCSKWHEPVAETLLDELAATLFQSNRYQALYQQCRSKLEANKVGDRLATELAESYRQMMQRQQDPVVQRFNALLN